MLDTLRRTCQHTMGTGSYLPREIVEEYGDLSEDLREVSKRRGGDIHT